MDNSVTTTTSQRISTGSVSRQEQPGRFHLESNMEHHNSSNLNLNQGPGGPGHINSNYNSNQRSMMNHNQNQVHTGSRHGGMAMHQNHNTNFYDPPQRARGYDNYSHNNSSEFQQNNRFSGRENVSDTRPTNSTIGNNNSAAASAKSTPNTKYSWLTPLVATLFTTIFFMAIVLILATQGCMTLHRSDSQVHVVKKSDIDESQYTSANPNVTQQQVHQNQHQHTHYPQTGWTTSNHNNYHNTPSVQAVSSQPTTYHHNPVLVDPNTNNSATVTPLLSQNPNRKPKPITYNNLDKSDSGPQAESAHVTASSTEGDAVKPSEVPVVDDKEKKN